MIVAVKKNKNYKLLKIILLVASIFMLILFLYNKNEERNELKKSELVKKEILTIEANKKEDTKKDMERAILAEVEKAVDLVGQEHIRTIKIIDNKIVIVCETDSNLEALFVIYGAMALIKKTLSETVIAVDVNFILKSKFQ